MRYNPYAYGMSFGTLSQILPGIRATGKPGEVDIPGVGVRKLQDMRQDHIWDRVAIAAVNAAGTEVVFFRDIQGKTRLETNMSQSAKLPEGQEAVVYRVNFVVVDSCAPKDKQEIYDKGYGEFVMDDDNRVLSGPIICFPQAYGMYGNIMTTSTDSDEGVVTAGVPSPGAIPRLMLPIFISENRTFRFNLWFYEACNLPSVAASAAWTILDVVWTRPLR